MNWRTAHALIRFGLGRRGTEPLPASPDSWLRDQLEAPDPLLAQPLPSTANALAVIARHQELERQFVMASGNGPVPHLIGELFRAEQRELLLNVVTTALPFRERLVLFWLNHFTISDRRVLAECGAYVKEAIRPHVTGRFEDMLRAVMHHPAMLKYLDNFASIGPDSVAGKRRHQGLNENLARECLELHTVGVAAGYTQADVVSFARVLTGWTVDTQVDSPGFIFRPDWHEPGRQVVMGQTFPEGEAGGEAVLSFLANHPATHRRLATQLVQHFVADDPPPADVARIAEVLRVTGGDLKQATLEVTRLPSAWEPLTKLRQPVDYAVAVYRALDPATLDPAKLVSDTIYLGEPFLGAPLPNGWPDDAPDWMGGEAMVRRADFAWAMAGGADGLEPADLAARTLGDLLSGSTRAQIANPGSRREAVALLLASPEFMRR